ncbi:MAG: DUF6492 family protein [Cyanobacteria bacterium P01_G01_bin.19]
MDNKSCCIITPSYAPDFERCRLLSESIAQFSTSNLNHYIIVDRRDSLLFNQLKNQHTTIINKEDILPWWIFQIPTFTKKNIWFSLKTLPVRGWLIQQLIKLAIAKYIKEEVLIFADSDVFFIRPFDFRQYISEDGEIRFFREPDVVLENNRHLPRWYYDASDLLAIDAPQFPVANYMGQLVFWKKKNVLKLHQYLEKIHQKRWIEVLCNQWNFSEYILYGVFVEKNLKETSGHYFDSQDLCLNYWEEEPMSESEIKQFFANVTSKHIAVMLSAKAGISIDKYQQYISASVSENN